jgi:hypothetical protein
MLTRTLVDSGSYSERGGDAIDHVKAVFGAD